MPGRIAFLLLAKEAVVMVLHLSRSRQARAIVLFGVPSTIFPMVSRARESKVSNQSWKEARLGRAASVFGLMPTAR